MSIMQPHRRSTLRDGSGVNLSFWRWLKLENSYCDHASVQVSRDGANWTTVWENVTADGSIYDTAWVQKNL